MMMVQAGQGGMSGIGFGGLSRLWSGRGKPGGQEEEKVGLAARFPLVVKALLPVFLSVILSAVAGGYGMQQLRTVETDYQGLVILSERSKAAFEATGAARALAIAARELLSEEDKENLEYMKEDIEQIRRKFIASAESLFAILPDRKADIESAILQFSHVATATEEARKLALAGDRRGAAYVVNNRLQVGETIAQFESLGRDVTTMINRVEEGTQARYQEAVRVSVAVGGIGGLTALVVAVLLTIHSVSRPLERVVAEMTRLSSGELDIVIHGRNRRDEVGATARAVAVFQQSMLEARSLRQQQSEMRGRAEADKREAMERLAYEFQQEMAEIVSTVDNAATDMRATATELTAAADRANSHSGAVGQGAGEAAQSIEMVAAATEQLSASIREIATHVDESGRISSQAVAGARRSEEAVAILLDAAQQISDVVRLINRIAGMTNLLALNATIEAARAGDAGLGFAIVAREVKELAHQTATATTQVEQQISAILSATDIAAEAIHGVGATILRMAEISTAISAAVTEQEQATRDIAQSAMRAASSSGNAQTVTGEMIQGAGRTGIIAGTVLDAADNLVAEASHLRGAIDRFVDRVRAS
jgi:methyl-accepting chemotaxis protein